MRIVTAHSLDQLRNRIKDQIRIPFIQYVVWGQHEKPLSGWLLRDRLYITVAGGPFTTPWLRLRLETLQNGSQLRVLPATGRVQMALPAVCFLIVFFVSVYSTYQLAKTGIDEAVIVGAALVAFFLLLFAVAIYFARLPASRGDMNESLEILRVAIDGKIFHPQDDSEIA